MQFFDQYDFFNFKLFNMNFNMIFDQHFTMDCWIKADAPHPHAHETWELYFVRSGSVTVHCDGKSLTVSENQILLIPPRAEHYLLETAEQVSFGSIRFTYSEVEKDAIGTAIDRILNGRRFTPLSVTPDVRQAFDGLREKYREYHAYKDKKLWLYPKLTACCMTFMASVLEAVSSPALQPSVRYPQNKDLLPMIIEFFMLYASDSDIMVEDLANSLNYSVSQTNRILQQNFGKSFRAMMNDIRVRKAKYYLVYTNFSIKKISDILGFKEPKNFNKSFKATVGVTPTVYRQHNTKSEIRQSHTN